MQYPTIKTGRLGKMTRKEERKERENRRSLRGIREQVSMDKLERIYFNGIWRKTGEPDIYIYTDGVTRSTFTVVEGESFERSIRALRCRFGRAYPDNQALIYPR